MSHEHLQTLTEIRGMMERSTKFLSLSGLSGVSAGLVAMGGAMVAYLRLRTSWFTVLDSGQYDRLTRPSMTQRETLDFLLIDALVVLVLAVLAAWFFTSRKARRQGLTVWNSASRRLIWALVVPLAAAGVFCVGLVYQHAVWLVCPTMLTFYGLTLLNASRYTYRDLEYLGLCEIGLGLLALFLTGYGLLMWTLGFGVLHIVYGTVMWFKYDQTGPQPASGPVDFDQDTL
ncbi:hypothetical protein J2I47_00770 [Fibrella sp. HMF5335]|uniref:Uncharacterized protein n=1 Tax=Fibrella rubiginis TaxID=2817060 RepID=A0A939G9R7_9BACT|nr:hypothetical protein [Fibrella rubiginis]MBO0935067.1 hypothetical protein [Fibrella rubiginis]